MDPSNPAFVPAVEWRYELRREAQEILRGLYVGPYQSSRDLNYMRSLGLTHVLCIQDSREAHLVKPRFPDAFNYHVLVIRDAQDQNLIRMFPEAKAFIDAALAGGGRILVHCGDGISRSPAIVTAYVMCTQHLSTEDAFQYVQARRFCVSPNAGFQHQIEAYQHIYEAAQQCASDPALNLRAHQGRKRIMEEDEQDEDRQQLECNLRQQGNRLVSNLPTRNVHRRLSPQEDRPSSCASLLTAHRSLTSCAFRRDMVLG